MTGKPANVFEGEVYEDAFVSRRASADHYAEYLHTCITERTSKSKVEHARLTAVPPEVLASSTLKRLVVANHRLTTMPVIASLRYLDVSNNRIGKLPSLKRLCHLEHLNLSNNQISSLKGIGVLSALTSLNLLHNNFVELPRELCSLTSLRSLDVRNNVLDEAVVGAELDMFLQALPAFHVITHKEKKCDCPWCPRHLAHLENVILTSAAELAATVALIGVNGLIPSSTGEPALEYFASVISRVSVELQILIGLHAAGVDQAAGMFGEVIGHLQTSRMHMEPAALSSYNTRAMKSCAAQAIIRGGQGGDEADKARQAFALLERALELGRISHCLTFPERHAIVQVLTSQGGANWTVDALFPAAQGEQYTDAELFTALQWKYRTISKVDLTEINVNQLMLDWRKGQALT